MGIFDSIFARLGMRTNTPAQATPEQTPPPNTEGAVAQNLGTPSTEGSKIMQSVSMDSSENPPGLPPEKTPVAQVQNPVEGAAQHPIMPTPEGGVKPL